LSHKTSSQNYTDTFNNLKDIMKISDYLATLPHDDRIRAMARLEGMTLAMRIIGNRAADLKEMAESSSEPHYRERMLSAENEIQTARSMVRLVQVNIGNGNQKFGDLSAAEIEEIMLIY
jgi:hypothetical protein